MGSKSSNLELLKNVGIEVPEGFVLPARFFQSMIAGKECSILERLNIKRTKSSLFSADDVPLEANQYIEQKLCAMPSVDSFAVRSSGTVFTNGEEQKEDSSCISLAGQFETYLNVPRDKIAFAVALCWNSLFNNRSMSSFNINNNYIQKSCMEVVVQELVPAKASAVVMTSIPDGDGKLGAMEFTWGACGALVSGMVNPDEVLFERSGGKIIEKYLGDKEYKLVLDVFKNGSENECRELNSDTKRAMFAFENGTILEVIKLAKEIEDVFDGVPQDVELVLDEEDKLVVVQSRPITTLTGPSVPFEIMTTH